MDFIDRIKELAAQVPKQLEHIKTEEATKTALIMPFIAALGYEVFNPAEVTPELTADVGTKKGERVDYAILHDGKPIILFECKPATMDIAKMSPTQLYRYFSVTEARFGILTNGIRYHVFSDLEEQNKMDTRPFLELDMLALEDPVIEQFKQFTKHTFDVDTVLTAAIEYKYTRDIKRILSDQLREPGAELVRLLASQVHHGPITQNVRDRFSQFVKRAWHQLVNDLIAERLKLTVAPPESETAPTSEPAPEDAPKILTTAEELEAFYIIKAILRGTVDVKRVTLRDAQTYCSILLDDNNRRPICRLYFSQKTKAIAFLDAERREARIPLANMDDMYALTDKIKAVAAGYPAK